MLRKCGKIQSKCLIKIFSILDWSTSTNLSCVNKQHQNLMVYSIKIYFLLMLCVHYRWLVGPYCLHSRLKVVSICNKLFIQQSGKATAKSRDGSESFCSNIAYQFHSHSTGYTSLMDKHSIKGKVYSLTHRIICQENSVEMDPVGRQEYLEIIHLQQRATSPI